MKHKAQGCVIKLQKMDSKRTRKLAELFLTSGLVKHAPPGNPFLLKSGKTSDIYVDLRTLGANPRLHALVGEALLDTLPSVTTAMLKGGIGYVAGLPLGGVPLATLVSHIGEIGMLLIRKQPKKHGTFRIVEADLTEPTSVVLVDDVLTTGSTVRETVERFKKSGVPITVVGVLCVVNRCDGAPTKVPETNIPLYSVLTLSDLRQRRRIPFGRRVSSNATATELFRLMDKKKTNVCWSADVDTPEELLRVFRVVAPHIAMIKVHFDAIVGLTSVDVGMMFRIAYENQVLVMGDRKFADIGATVSRQLQCHSACSEDVSLQMHCCTLHTIAGDAGIKALHNQGIDSVLVAQMSNAGSIFSSDYAEATASLAKSAGVTGMVCQSRNDCDAGDSFVYMTPGVHLERTTDGGDQRYRDCYQAIALQNNDIVIVGRGIHSSPSGLSPLEAVKRYQEAAWSAYSRK